MAEQARVHKRVYDLGSVVECKVTAAELSAYEGVAFEGVTIRIKHIMLRLGPWCNQPNWTETQININSFRVKLKLFKNSYC